MNEEQIQMTKLISSKTLTLTEEMNRLEVSIAREKLKINHGHVDLD